MNHHCCTDVHRQQHASALQCSHFHRNAHAVGLLQRVQELQAQYSQLQSTLDAEVAARHTHEAELEGTSEARHQALLAQEEARTQSGRANQLAKVHIAHAASEVVVEALYGHEQCPAKVSL